MRRENAPPFAWAGLALMFAILPPASACRRATARDKPLDPPVPYTILRDVMDTRIEIGVPPEITEGQLRATLAKAADDHQDDAARDYLVACCLRVQAFLVNGTARSAVPAGELQRSIPWSDPEERKKIREDRTRSDSVSIELDAARRTLP